jgi:hypothetical protein
MYYSYIKRVVDIFSLRGGCVFHVLLKITTVQSSAVRVVGVFPVL